MASAGAKPFGAHLLGFPAEALGGVEVSRGTGTSNGGSRGRAGCEGYASPASSVVVDGTESDEAIALALSQSEGGLSLAERKGLPSVEVSADLSPCASEGYSQ